MYLSRSLSHCLCGWHSRWPFLPRAIGVCASLWPWASATSAPCPAHQLIRVLLAAFPEPQHPVFLTMWFSTGFTGICRCCCPPPNTSSPLSHRTFPDLDLADPHHGTWRAAQQTWQLLLLLLKHYVPCLPHTYLGPRDWILVREREAFPSSPGPQQPDPSCSSPFANWMLTPSVRLKAPPEEDGRACYLEFLQGTQAPRS